ncbi:LysR family transcriptional regulator, partial [Rhizobium ruizarguesonis]
ARATGRPKATLSRRVAELESGLALRLFELGARNLKLTEEGRALFERTGALLAETTMAGNEIKIGKRKKVNVCSTSETVCLKSPSIGLPVN